MAKKPQSRARVTPAAVRAVKGEGLPLQHGLDLLVKRGWVRAARKFILKERLPYGRGVEEFIQRTREKGIGVPVNPSALKTAVTRPGDADPVLAAETRAFTEAHTAFSASEKQKGKDEFRRYWTTRLLEFFEESKPSSFNKGLLKFAGQRLRRGEKVPSDTILRRFLDPADHEGDQELKARVARLRGELRTSRGKR
ncbi:MAG TPA: hypothetical protein VJI67_00645 [archaeon]|nr:hypothetical protein [archaeon]HLD81527.1 hypothetical protein [archaeon]